MIEGRRIDIQGTVQGVGFRPWVYRLACAEGLRGAVWNDARGVSIEAFGPPAALARFEDRLVGTVPPAARIEALQTASIPPADAPDFLIVSSEGHIERRVSIPPDLATCPACEAEIRDPANRRARHPFANCTNCGPRFTIALDVPYDRPNTTMAPFAMCAACRREYETPANRRFHAQPNACPVCGPTLTAIGPNGQPIACADVMALAAVALRAGQIVAVKGIGGFHLACDATAPDVVNRLRARKQRDEKPFAVMVRTLAAAERLAVMSPTEAAVLCGPERPIVLLARREPSVLAPEVAPGNPLVGLMLPYSPLHHLLLADADRPLVMTSGNVSDEPIAHTNEEALRRLPPLADLLVLHDREIATRCDDSIVRVIAGAPTVLRRSRGYVPRAIRLRQPVSRPVLACGGLLKNTFCLAEGDRAYFGPHIGDLDHLETFRSYADAIERLQRFLDIAPEVIAYDLHPGYHSTRYALARPETVKIGVQHHHAHAASLMAEHGLAGPMFAVAYDGTGYGLDGTAWGGEVLLVQGTRSDRLATFRPLRLAGGDAAIRSPWRLALALLIDAFGASAPVSQLALFDQVRPSDRRVVQQMLERGVQVAPAHGVGRYFDAVGALLLERTRATYEGQVAVELNAIADPDERGSYPFEIALRGSLLEIDLRPGVRGLVHDLLAGNSPARLSARLHRTIGAATAAVLEQVRLRHGTWPIGLTGGCFQNTLLVEDLLNRLSQDEVYTHRAVPPGDGGLALGQVVVAGQVDR